MAAELILQPVFVVGLLTMVITIWMYVTRIHAMYRLGIAPQQAQDAHKIRELLPIEVSRISNNYNNLFEQPVLFYVVAICITLLGHVDALHIGCAWAYAILRIIHSAIQATIDWVIARFCVFILSWVVLSIMLIREAIAVVG